MAWKSRPFLNGGSVATRSTVSESMPRRKSRLSPWYRVRLRKLRSAMLVVLRVWQGELRVLPTVAD